MKRIGLYTFGLVAVALVALPLQATDFIRGDANGDGVVSISDAYFINAFLFLGIASPECGEAVDADSNGTVQLTDAVRILNVKFLGIQAIGPPFPNAGPDPDPTNSLGCVSYGHGSPLDDPAAKMQVSGTALGGIQRRAVITILVSSTGPIAGYSGTIVDEHGALETSPASQNVRPTIVDLPGIFSGGFQSCRIIDGRMTFGLIWSLFEGKEFPGGQDVPVVDFIACLKPGTAAGQYPLTLESGELIASCVPQEGLPPGGVVIATCTGRAIHPTLVSGILTVESDVTGTNCDTNPPEPPPPINIRYLLEDKTGVPGGNVSIPFKIQADRASQGFSYSIEFDEAILHATGHSKIFQTASGTPYEFEKFEENNDTGFIVGAAVISLTDTGDVLPPNTLVEVLKFHFQIDPLAPAGSTELKFVDGGHGTGGPVRNKLIATGQDITPDNASSFVFVNGLLNIVPDGIPFVRGDSNSDESVNISDPQFTLNFLFLGGPDPRCFDAADANDDGKVDISDAVTTLQFLFLGHTLLPPPRTPGLDPTPDGLGCDLGP